MGNKITIGLVLGWGMFGAVVTGIVFPMVAPWLVVHADSPWAAFLLGLYWFYAGVAVFMVIGVIWGLVGDRVWKWRFMALMGRK